MTRHWTQEALDCAQERSKRSGRASTSSKARKSPQRALRKAAGPSGKPRLPESAVLRACMELLEAHPKVALVWRANVGAVQAGDRYVRFGFRGCSDILGVMAGSGKLLACECKATGKRMSDDQAAFLENVSRAGGYALCVDDPSYLSRWLEVI